MRREPRLEPPNAASTLAAGSLLLAAQPWHRARSRTLTCAAGAAPAEKGMQRPPCPLPGTGLFSWRLATSWRGT